jgi:hypothetical protein
MYTLLVDFRSIKQVLTDLRSREQRFLAYGNLDKKQQSDLEAVVQLDTFELKAQQDEGSFGSDCLNIRGAFP